MADDHKTYELQVEPRKQEKKASRKLAHAGLVPGVVYGHNVQPESVAVPQREFDRVYLRAGSNTLVDLRIGQSAEPRKVFIHEVQRHPETQAIRHVDFHAVNLREEITTTVPVVHTGESPIVAAGEGLLLNLLDHVQIRALPGDIPSLFEVDISGLDEVGKSVHASDLQVPSGVQLLTPGEEALFSVTHLPTATEEEAEEAAEAVEAAEDAEGGAEEGGAEGESGS